MSPAASAPRRYVSAMATSAPGAQPGLRERKKQRTRELIAETARRLFVERGFDGVTVAEIARAAEVAEKTVFNYFPTKEDLVYWRLEAFEAQLLAAIRERPAGTSALDAFGRFLAAQRGWLAEKNPEAGGRMVAVARMITDSPALMAREQQVFEQFTHSLAALLAEETGAQAGDVTSWVAANALMGVHRALVVSMRRGVLAGVARARLARDVTEQADRALGALAQGLGGYAVKPADGG
jgi:AcrR family transcriptional regulator